MKLFVFPGVIEQRILSIGARQIPYMRTAAFSALVKECEALLLKQVGCRSGSVLFYTASGTAAMDAVVANYVSTKTRTLVVAGGSFGYRWRELCQYYRVPCETFEVPFAREIDYAALEQKITEFKPEVLLCQHHETSSGQLYDMGRISQLCRQTGTVLVSDIISSFLADPFHMDDLGVDIAVLSSQKGLNLPPGLSFVVLSERVLKEKFAHLNFYLDIEENLKNLTRGQTPYSPATTLFLQLHARLLQIDAEGTASIIEKVRKNALFFREQCRRNGWPVPAENPSNCITGFQVRTDGYKIFGELLKEEIYIMPGSINNYLRVAHLGMQGPDDLALLADKIKQLDQ